ncbi:MAG: hypothetical protein E2604_14175 [Flavobacterium sp.]|nr:hypothetical protein [Flavobacterium sp.]
MKTEIKTSRKIEVKRSFKYVNVEGSVEVQAQKTTVKRNILNGDISVKSEGPKVTIKGGAGVNGVTFTAANNTNGDYVGEIKYGPFTFEDAQKAESKNNTQSLFMTIPISSVNTGAGLKTDTALKVGTEHEGAVMTTYEEAKKRENDK